ncbi:MAG: hypothetical protein CM15mP93_13540 [Thiotrichaceae bacterium]|nr:MAG: hypothetical protein CM15mP93_13540 [Thiotrichaceae bacterium]
MFLNHDVLIIGEVEIKVSHNVLSNCSKISDINKIYAHPQSFAQCCNGLTVISKIYL